MFKEVDDMFEVVKWNVGNDVEWKLDLLLNDVEMWSLGLDSDGLSKEICLKMVEDERLWRIREGW